MNYLIDKLIDDRLLIDEDVFSFRRWSAELAGDERSGKCKYIIILNYC